MGELLGNNRTISESHFYTTTACFGCLFFGLLHAGCIVNHDVKLANPKTDGPILQARGRQAGISAGTGKK